MDELIHVKVADGTSFDLSLHLPEGDSPAPVAVLGPAMGVRGSYYAPLAQALSDQGYTAVTLDLRGLGTSSVRAGRGTDFGYREIVETDFPAAIQALRDFFPKAPIFWIGHSLGGQLACLYAALEPQALAGIALIASCSVDFRGYRFPKSLGVFAFENMAWLSACFLGYFPGESVGFGGREARRLLRDWSHQGRTGRYEPSGSNHDYEALLAQLDLPVLAIAFTDDPYCPRRAVEGLLDKMTAARKRFLHLDPRDLGERRVGHFAWVKQPELVVPRLTEWMREELR